MDYIYYIISPYLYLFGFRLFETDSSLKELFYRMFTNSHSPLWVHIGAGSWSRGFVSQIFLRLIFSETSISQGQKPKKSAYKVFRQIFYSSLKLRLSKFQRTTQNMTFIWFQACNNVLKRLIPHCMLLLWSKLYDGSNKYSFCIYFTCFFIILPLFCKV